MMRRKILSTYTVKIIIINIAVYIFSLIMLGIFAEKYLNFMALTPSLIFSGKNLWTIFTSIFTHTWAIHLLANMISLFFIGLFVEQLIGKKRFLSFYLISGIFASIFYATLAFLLGNSEIGAKIFGSPLIPALGASGAIFGLLGLLAILTPKNRVYLIAGPLIAIVLQAVLSPLLSEKIMEPVSLLITIYIFFSLFVMFSFSPKMRRFAIPLEMPFWVLPIVAIVPLVILGLVINLPFGNSGHFGGLLAGLAYGYYLKRKYPRKTKMISKYFSK